MPEGPVARRGSSQWEWTTHARTAKLDFKFADAVFALVAELTGNVSVCAKQELMEASRSTDIDTKLLDAIDSDKDP